MAGRQNRDTERRLLADRSDEDAIVRRGALDSASARAYISSIEKDNDKAVEAINNSLTSSGATVANELAARQAANENRQKAVARVLDSEENEKASARRNRRYIDNQIGELNNQKARNWVELASNIAGAAGNLGYAYLDGGTTPLINQQSKIEPVGTSKTEQVGTFKTLPVSTSSLDVKSPIPQEITPLTPLYHQSNIGPVSTSKLDVKSPLTGNIKPLTSQELKIGPVSTSELDVPNPIPSSIKPLSHEPHSLPVSTSELDVPNPLPDNIEPLSQIRKTKPIKITPLEKGRI